MATVQKIREGVFLILWNSENPTFTQRCTANVTIDEISQSLRLILKALTCGNTRVVGCALGIEVISPTINKNTLEFLKPASILAIKNGVKQSMQPENLTGLWTTMFSGSCQCGRPTTTSNFDILIDFNLAFKKTETKRVLDQLLHLWETKTLADVTFKFKENEVKAHMSIIASASPIFSAMFQSNFKDMRDKVVEIKFIKSSVFEKMLRFIYTGDADLDSVNVADLLIAAKKYGVDSLKEECLLYLAANPTIGSSIILN